MTGFGTAEGPLGGGRITVEARTVNHRHFNSQFRLPPVLQRYESEMRAR
ncbi:MAG: YicC/YloC family endoribonuclease, partial [Gemmatimonadales bacterium]